MEDRSSTSQANQKKNHQAMHTGQGLSPFPSDVALRWPNVRCIVRATAETE